MKAREVSPRFALGEIERRLGWPLAAELAELVGTGKATVEQWRVRGLSHRQADRVACALGYHPMEFWPEWIDTDVVEHGDPRAQRPTRVSRPSAYGAIGSHPESVQRAAARRRLVDA